MEQTIEQLVAETILQKQSGHIEIDGHTYPICQPTLATIIEVSAAISKLPEINPEAPFLDEVLGKASQCKPLAEICTILLLGAERISQKVKVGRRLPWKRRKTEYDTLYRLILYNVSPRQLNQVIQVRLAEMQLGDFFGLTTSLSKVNITQRTREVEKTNQTQSGH